jgi:hypothetical protein
VKLTRFVAPRFALDWLLLIATGSIGFCQNRYRTELGFPDVPGYVTLRCDLHMHSVFSDGTVSPTVRVEEAWRNGLDAIALSDHVEHLLQEKDITTNHGRSFELASAAAKPLGLIVIRAAEISNGEPPGHLNALFLTDVSALADPNPSTAVSNAFAQGAFLFWNHPGWMQEDKKSVWYADQEAFYTNGWLQGIEIVNGRDYDRIAHGWCLDKNLTLVGNSDVHDPISFDYTMTGADLRPFTLVFAKQRSADAIKEALFARRTAVVSEGKVYGNATYLAALFQRSIEVINPELTLRPKQTALLQIRNKAPIDLELRLNPRLPELDVVSKATLKAGKVSLVEVSCPSGRVIGNLDIFLPCKVINFVVAPGKYLDNSLKLKVSYPGPN